MLYINFKSLKRYKPSINSINFFILILYSISCYGAQLNITSGTKYKITGIKSCIITSKKAHTPIFNTYRVLDTPIKPDTIKVQVYTNVVYTIRREL